MSTSTTAQFRLPSGSHATDRLSARVKLRRGLAFLALTLLVPGSAQLAAGDKRLGRLAVRVWAGLWGVLLGLGLLTLGWRGGAVAVLTSGAVLWLAQVLLVVLGIGWGLLLVDAWRISRPPELARRHRLGFALLTGSVVFAVVGGLLASAVLVSEQRDLMGTVFAGGGDRVSSHGRLTILLMGGDAGKGRVGLRPDSMTVASVDEQTGRTLLFSLPRNLEDVPFPGSSPLHHRFPRGYGCADHSCMLNAVYTYATAHKELYPGVRDPGAKATEEAVEGATGLHVNYYVLIDLKGFEALVDAVGGITLDVNRRVPIGGGPTHPVYGYVEPGHDVHLDGYHALWFGRSRSDSSDYDRIARQKCVLNAMLNQLDPVTVLTKFNRIASAGKEIVATDVPTAEVNTLMTLAQRAKSLPMRSLAFVPPVIHPGRPDFPKMRSLVAAKIAAAENADARAASPGPATAQPKTSASPKHRVTTAGSRTASARRDTDNLTRVCTAR